MRKAESKSKYEFITNIYKNFLIELESMINRFKCVSELVEGKLLDIFKTSSVCITGCVLVFISRHTNKFQNLISKLLDSNQTPLKEETLV